MFVQAKFKHYFQLDEMDCGSTCLRMVANYYGKNYSNNLLREYCCVVKDGVSLLGLSQAAEKIGFEVCATLNQIDFFEEQNLPCILHWHDNHFVVLIEVNKKNSKTTYKVADPSHGIITLSEEKFRRSWVSNDDNGIALFLEPTEKFYQIEPPKEEKLKVEYLLEYLAPYKRQIIYMFLLLFLGSGATLILPFLTQVLIDDGVNEKNINVIFTVLAAQLCLFLGTLVVEIFRNWLMLYVGTKLSITIISDFLKKVLQLPLKFFDTKQMGDFNQRIQDNERIEEFLSSQSLLTFFSVISFSVFLGFYGTIASKSF